MSQSVTGLASLNEPSRPLRMLSSTGNQPSRNDRLGSYKSLYRYSNSLTEYSIHYYLRCTFVDQVFQLVHDAVGYLKVREMRFALQV